jgi:hypothetical protein
MYLDHRNYVFFSHYGNRLHNYNHYFVEVVFVPMACIHIREYEKFMGNVIWPGIIKSLLG